MEFQHERKVHYPASVLLEVLIERMEAIVPFLPNVASIETLEKKRLRNGCWSIVRRWKARADQIPAIARPYLPPEILQWLDHARWTPQEYKVDWYQEPEYAPAAQLYECRGTNYFLPDPANPSAESCVRVTGVLRVYPERLPGVPGWIARRVGPRVEQFIVRAIQPNLSALAVGLESLLNSRSRKGRRRCR